MQDNLSSERLVPKIPKIGERIPLIIDSDAACEVDDQYAITLAIHSPERFDIEGFVGTHFSDMPGSARESAAKISRVLALSGLDGKWPVKQGGDPLQYSSVPTESEGADFIVERAMAHSPEQPLWIVVLGACTNLVSAYLKCPEIAKRVVVQFHGRTRYWPEKCYSFNVHGDIKAARVVLTSRLPLVLFDTGTYLYASAEETETRLAPHGPIGSYLHEIRKRWKSHLRPTKAFFDLGDIAFLVDPSLAYWEEVAAPSFSRDMLYTWDEDYGSFLRVYQIDRDGAFGLLYSRLADKYQR